MLSVLYLTDALKLMKTCIHKILVNNMNTCHGYSCDEVFLGSIKILWKNCYLDL